MKELKLWLVALLAVFFLAACSDDDDDDDDNPPPPPVATSKVQVVHASQDAPNVNVLVNGSQALGDVPFTAASGRLDVPAETNAIQVDGITPDGDVTVIGPVDIAFNEGELTTIVAANTVANIEPIVVTQMDSAVTAGQVRIGVIHAASNAPMVDVYATAPGADLAASTPIAMLSYTENLAPLEVPAGDYQIRITPAGDPDTVVYDSGTATLVDGSVLTFVAVANTRTGDNPVNLLVVGSDGANTLLDANTPSDLRVVHASPDAPAVDVVIDDNFAVPAVVGLMYPEFTDYLTVPADEYNVKVLPTTAITPAVIDASVGLDAGVSYSVLAVDFLSDIRPLILTDERRSVATEAQLRVVHGSPSAGAVDVYLVAPGTDITNVTPTLANVEFEANSGFLSVAPGDYEVIVTGTGNKAPQIGPAAVTLTGGGIYTAIARDAIGGGIPLALILTDDFVAR